MGHTNMKLKHHHMKRGPRYRQERRHLKRTGIPIITILSNQEFNELIADLQDTHIGPVNPGVPVDTTIKIVTDLCPVCSASGDDPCVTKTGNKAKQHHAGRDTL